MGAKNVLIESGYKYGEEYSYLLKKLNCAQAELIYFQLRNFTDKRTERILSRLEFFAKENLKFTIGSVDYLELIEFIKASQGVITDDCIRGYLGKFLGYSEINPMNFGYKKYNLKSLIQKIRSLGELAD